MHSKSETPWIRLVVAVAVLSLAALVIWQARTEEEVAEIHGARSLDPDLIELDSSVHATSSSTTPSLEVVEVPSPTPIPTPAPTPEPEEEDERTSEPIEIAMASPPGGLGGWVLDDEGSPLTGAEVKLRFEKLIEDGVEAPKLEMLSGENGVFRFDSVPPGPWTVVAEHPGFSLGTKTGVHVKSNAYTGSIEVVMEAALTLKGTVKTPGGQALKDVDVQLAKRLLSIREDSGKVVSFDMPYRSATTDKNGAFTIERTAPGVNIVSASFEGFVTEREELNLEADGDLSIELVLAPSSSIGGTVRTQEGTPVEGAVVTAVDPSDKKTKHEATTQPDGAFLLSGLRGGRTYELTAKAANLAPTGPIEVPAGRLEVVIVLGAGGAITGTITDFTSASPMEGIAVSLRSADGAFSIARLARSGADGTYRIGHLPSGKYDVRIQDEKLTSEPRLGVNVKIPNDTGKIDFVVYEGKTISGTVVEDFTGERIAGARVTLQSQAGAGFLTRSKSEVTTDEFGSFNVENLPFGYYSLEATADGYLASPNPEATADVRLVPGAVVEPVTLLLSRGGTITGQVTDTLGGSLGGAVVQLFNAPGAKKTIKTDKLTALSAADGSFKITGIPVDNQVEVQASAWLSGWAKGKSDRIILSDMLPTAETVIFLRAGSPIAVRVEDEFGNGVAEANVNLNHGEFPGDKRPDEWTSKTGPQGTVLFDQIPPGRVSISAGKSGYVGGGTSVNVEAGLSADAVIQLEQGHRIWGYVEDDGGELITEGKVMVRGESGARGSGSSKINQEGYFEITGIGAGTFTLDVRATRDTSAGKHTVRRVVSGVPSDSEAPPIQVPFNGCITGTVLDGGTLNSIKGVNVRIQGRYEFRDGRQATFKASKSFSDGEGRFEFPSIPPGEYQVYFTASNYLPVEVEEVMVYSPGTRDIGRTLMDSGGAIAARVVSSDGGEPIARATVRVVPDGGSASTNAEGKARIAPLEPGIYNLEISHAEYLATEKKLIHVKSGEETDAGTIEMDPGGRLVGRVINDQDEPIVGANVRVRSSEGEGERSANTNAAGRIQMQGLEPGGIIITITAKSHDLQITKSFHETISSDKETQFEIALIADAEIRGTLHPSGGGMLLQPEVAAYPLEADGQPVTGSRRAGEVRGNSFLIENLVEGTYLVTSAATTSSGERAYWFRALELRAASATVILSPGTARLSGRVLSATDGLPIPGARVRVRGLSFPQTGSSALQNWWEWSTTTDDLGYYRFEGLRGGTYEVVAACSETGHEQMEIISLRTGENDAAHDLTLEE
ncbi:carboxypeptidase regulatory-like domain-containing protein [bacterium]|nr:carboxypeptidase regulatory-like domain-containing protein [bacterium]